MDLIAGLIKGLRGFVRNETGGSEHATGQIIDRRNHESAAVVLACGTPTGAPTNILVAYRVRHGDAADLSDAADLVAATTWLNGNVAACTDKELEVSLDLVALGCKRYFRVYETVTFTGGTTPAIPLASVVALGGAKVLPAV